MRFATKYRRFLFCLLFLLFTSGVGYSGPIGKIKNHTYYSPADNFHVPIPEGFGVKVNDMFEKENGLGSVSFHDDFGQNNVIHYFRVPAEVLLKLDTDETKHQKLQGWLHNVVMPTWLSTVSPDCKLLRETSGTFEEMPAVFAMVSLPGGSTLMITRNGETHRGNSRRGLVLFFKGSWLYMLAAKP